MYSRAKRALATGGLDLSAATLRWKLCAAAKSAAVSNFARSTFASLTHITAWVGTDIRTLSGPVVTLSAGSAGNTLRWDATARVWTASAALSALYVVIGVSGGRAIAWCKLSAATAVGAGNTLTITPNAAGLFTLTGGIT